MERVISKQEPFGLSNLFKTQPQLALGITETDPQFEITLFIFQYGGRRANQLRVQHGIPQHPVKGEPQVLTITKNFYSSIFI
jgi:hypothetical protein